MRIRLHKKLSSRIKLLLFVSLLVVFLAVVVGCGESADSGQTVDSEPIKESPMATGDTLGTGKAQSEPLTLADASKNDNELLDGVFNRLWADPPTLDPHLTSDTTSSGVVVEIFGGLVTFDTDLNLVPDLAESFEISADSLTYTFVIRDTAVFHSGKPVTSSDIKWSLERAANPDTASPVAETYLGDIIGVQDVLNGVTDQLSGVAVIDDKTIQIKIDSPKAYFLQKLTYPTAYVLDRENVESGGRSWTDDPNGTGPFKLIEYKIGERIIFLLMSLNYL